MCARHSINLGERTIRVLLPKSTRLLHGAVPEIERFLRTLHLRTEDIIFQRKQLFSHIAPSFWVSEP